MRIGAGQIDNQRKLCTVTDVIDADRMRVAWRGQEYECRGLPDTSYWAVGDAVYCHALPDNSELVAVYYSLGIDAIIIWSGSIATIPTGFQLCDGTGVTPDLRDYFVLGVWPPDEAGDYGAHFPLDGWWGSNIGDTGGDDTRYDEHRHARGTTSIAVESAHHHEWSGTIQVHSLGDQSGSDVAVMPGHDHTLNAADDSATTEHRHIILSAARTAYALVDHDNRPPYYAAAYIYGNVNPPVGGIVLWSGLLADIPVGYHVCDGYDATPDLRERFVIGAGSGYAVGATGGYWNDEDQGTEHSHEIDIESADHTHEDGGLTTSIVDAIANASDGVIVPDVTAAAMPHQHNLTVQTDSQSHTHAVTGALNEIGSSFNENAPLYYTLAYIMRLA